MRGLRAEQKASCRDQGSRQRRESCDHPINTGHNRRIARQRAAVVANADIGNIDIFKVAAINDESVTAANAITDYDPVRPLNVHSSPHQFERFVNRDVGRWFAAVGNNVPVLRRPVGRRVFRAE